MKILIAGDYCDRYRVTSLIEQEDYQNLFSQIKPIVESCDYRIVNFEFPVVVDAGSPIPKCGPNLKGQKKAVDAIKYAGFNICTLANNHILDQGEKCCLSTKQLLESSGIKTVGAGKNSADASNILYLKIKDEVLGVINCCEHEFSIANESSAGANPLDPIAQYYTIKEAKRIADYVVVIVHGGHEHYQLPSPRMQETYRFFVDAGADAVVNHHQHCYSGYEQYKGKPIYYGLGNFLFDDPHKRNDIWNEGFMLELVLEKERDIEFKLYPYSQCNEKAEIHLLDSIEKDRFYKRIKELNDIISHPSELKRQHKQMMEDTYKEYELIFQPLHTRITDALFRRGMWPSILNKRQKLLFYNFIACESHVERLLNVLTNYSK